MNRAYVTVRCGDHVKRQNMSLTEIILMDELTHFGPSFIIINKCIITDIHPAMWSFDVFCGVSSWILHGSYHGSHMDWKTWKNGKTFSSQGKVREFWTDWKRQGILPNILEKSGNFSQFLFLVFLWFFLIEVYLLNRILYLLNPLNETLKKILEMEKNTGKVREIC